MAAPLLATFVCFPTTRLACVENPPPPYHIPHWVAVLGNRTKLVCLRTEYIEMVICSNALSCATLRPYAYTCEDLTPRKMMVLPVFLVFEGFPFKRNSGVPFTGSLLVFPHFQLDKFALVFEARLCGIPPLYDFFLRLSAVILAPLSPSSMK